MFVGSYKILQSDFFHVLSIGDKLVEKKAATHFPHKVKCSFEVLQTEWSEQKADHVGMKGVVLVQQSREEDEIFGGNQWKTAGRHSLRTSIWHIGNVKFQCQEHEEALKLHGLKGWRIKLF